MCYNTLVDVSFQIHFMPIAWPKAYSVHKWIIKPILRLDIHPFVHRVGAMMIYRCHQIEPVLVSFILGYGTSLLVVHRFSQMTVNHRSRANDGTIK